MHKARAFFSVCAGLFLLALAYHMGARSAGAQAGAQIECPCIVDGVAAAVINRQVHWRLGYRTGGVSPTIPGTARVVACDANDALLENGDCYTYEPGTDWIYNGNLMESPTSVQRITIGQLKARYATPASGR